MFFDCHAHTGDLSSCCAPDVTVASYREAVQALPHLAGVAITNHGFSIYFPPEIGRRGLFIERPELFDQFRASGNARLERHLAEVSRWRAAGLRTGIEVELMNDDRLTVDPVFRDRLDVIVGSVHFLPGIAEGNQSEAAVLAAWWEHMERLVGTGVHIIGHPLRWLVKTACIEIDSATIRRLVRLAEQHDVALELNGHIPLDSDVELLRTCVDAGVTVAMSTDAHRRERIGVFGYHRELLHHAGLRWDQLRVWWPEDLPRPVDSESR